MLAGARPSACARTVAAPAAPLGRTIARHLPWNVFGRNWRKLCTSFGLAVPAAASSAAPPMLKLTGTTASGTSSPANPNKINPLPPPRPDPVPRHSQPPPCVLADIRQIEYSNKMPSQLRAYQATVFQALAHPTRIDRKSTRLNSSHL